MRESREYDRISEQMGDRPLNNDVNVRSAIVSQAFTNLSVVVMPEHIYTHITENHVGNLLDNVKELSYADIAFILKLNEEYEYLSIEESLTSNVISRLPISKQHNVSAVLTTFNKGLLDDFLFGDDERDCPDDPFYKVIQLNDVIVITISRGFGTYIKDLEYKLDFLKELIGIFYKILGDVETHRTRIYKEFITLL